MANSKGFYSELPTWAKGTVAVVAIGSLVLLGIAIRNAIRTAREGSGDRKDDREIENATNNALNALQNQGVTPTLNDADAISLARTIEIGLAGCELSGTELSIIEQIKNKMTNQADWFKLQQVFGVRTIDNCGYLTGDTNYDLKTLLLEQLDGFTWTGTKYANILVQDLKNKGITF